MEIVADQEPAVRRARTIAEPDHSMVERSPGERSTGDRSVGARWVREHAMRERAMRERCLAFVTAHWRALTLREAAALTAGDVTAIERRHGCALERRELSTAGVKLP